MNLREQIDQSYSAALEGLDIPWMLEQWAERAPDKVCLIWCPLHGEDRNFTDAELFED